MDTKYFKVRRDVVELPGGQQKDWTYWDSNDSAMVIGLTEDKKLVMIRQYRYLVNDEVIEFSSGSLHDNEPIEVGAKREFEEETGYTCSPEPLVRLGSFYETYGQLNRRIHIFFADKVKKSTQTLDNGEDGYEDIRVELVEYNEAVKLALEGKIAAMGSTLAMLLLHEKRKEPGLNID